MNTKQREHSLERIGQAIAIIEELAPREQKREARDRRKKMEKAYESMALHAGKLGIELPRLSTFYNPEQYLSHAQIAAGKVAELKGVIKPQVLAVKTPLRGKEGLVING